MKECVIFTLDPLKERIVLRRQSTCTYWAFSERDIVHAFLRAEVRQRFDVARCCERVWHLAFRDKPMTCAHPYGQHVLRASRDQIHI